VDAFLLKIVIEERLGYPVHLISDGLLPGIESALNLSGMASVYAALASGEVHMYPEASGTRSSCSGRLRLLIPDFRFGFRTRQDSTTDMFARTATYVLFARFLHLPF
jgi:hypothetical protein